MMKHRRLAMIILPVILFALVISVNFFKPFGFFRESTPAMVCINANSWNKYPALKNEHIPVGSYGFDPNAKPSTQMWNTVTTFGYGWFLAPYYFFSILHLPPDEISIRTFSLLWLAFTLLVVYKLSRHLTKQSRNSSSVTYLTLLFYLFSAAALWYHVQGYVHEIAVLPLYLLSWLFFMRYIESYSAKWLVALCACLFVSVQFDWLPCIQAAVMSLFLFTRRKNIPVRFAFLMPALCVLLAVAYIIYTYSQWATLPVYAMFLKQKFLTRTVGSGGLQLLSGLNYNFNLLVFYLSGFGLLCGFFIWSIAKKYKLPPAIWLIIITAWYTILFSGAFLQSMTIQL